MSDTTDKTPDYVVGVSGKEWTRLHALIPELESERSRLAAENTSMRAFISIACRTASEETAGRTWKQLADILSTPPSEHVARIEKRLELANELRQNIIGTPDGFTVTEDALTKYDDALRAFREGV